MQRERGGNGGRDGEAPWDPEASPAFWINRVSRALMRRGDGRLRPLGFAMSYLPVLRALALARHPLSQKELARSAGVEQPTMTETIARLVRDGLVERDRNPDDKRSSGISLTRLSRARFPKARAVLLESEREAMDGLSDDEKALLRGLLKRVLDNLETTGDPQARGASDE
jgi:MarR family transcriptional regulator, transcriptional regulator for hemolysin